MTAEAAAGDTVFTIIRNSTKPKRKKIELSCNAIN